MSRKLSFLIYFSGGCLCGVFYSSIQAHWKRGTQKQALYFLGPRCSTAQTAEAALRAGWAGGGGGGRPGAAAEAGGRKTRCLCQQHTACLPLRWDQSQHSVSCPSCKATSPPLRSSEGIGHLSLSFPPSALELLEALFERRRLVTIASACVSEFFVEPQYKAAVRCLNYPDNPVCLYF